MAETVDHPRRHRTGVCGLADVDEAGISRGRAAFESAHRFYSVDDMRIAPDARHLACGCWFGQRGLWVWRSLESPSPELVVRDTKQAVRCPLAIAQDERLGLRRWPDLMEVGAWTTAASDVRCIEVSPDRAWVGVAGHLRGYADAAVAFHCAASGRVEHRLSSAAAAPSSVAFSADGSLVATAHARGELRCHRVGTWEAVLVGRAAPEALSAVAFWPTGRRLVASGRDARRGPPVLAWDLPLET